MSKKPLSHEEKETVVDLQLVRLLIRKWGRCQECNSIKHLTIHHIDHDKNNNKIRNLMCLCAHCHAGKHGGMYVSKTVTDENERLTIGSVFDYDFLISKKKKLEGKKNG